MTRLMQLEEMVGKEYLTATVFLPMVCSHNATQTLEPHLNIIVDLRHLVDKNLSSTVSQ